jgi:hypothetical protein
MTDEEIQRKLRDVYFLVVKTFNPSAYFLSFYIFYFIDLLCTCFRS